MGEHSHNYHHRNEIILMLSLLILFSLFFILALMDIHKGIPVFGIGVSHIIEDILIMVLSFLAVIKVVWHLIFH